MIIINLQYVQKKTNIQIGEKKIYLNLKHLILGLVGGVTPFTRGFSRLVKHIRTGISVREWNHLGFICLFSDGLPTGGCLFDDVERGSPSWIVELLAISSALL